MSVFLSIDSCLTCGLIPGIECVCNSISCNSEDDIQCETELSDDIFVVDNTSDITYSTVWDNTNIVCPLQEYADTVRKCGGIYTRPGIYGDGILPSLCMATGEPFKFCNPVKSIVGTKGMGILLEYIENKARNDELYGPNNRMTILGTTYDAKTTKEGCIHGRVFGIKRDRKSPLLGPFDSQPVAGGKINRTEHWIDGMFRELWEEYSLVLKPEIRKELDDIFAICSQKKKMKNFMIEIAKYVEDVSDLKIKKVTNKNSKYSRLCAHYVRAINIAHLVPSNEQPVPFGIYPRLRIYKDSKKTWSHRKIVFTIYGTESDTIKTLMQLSEHLMTNPKTEFSDCIVALSMFPLSVAQEFYDFEKSHAFLCNDFSTDPCLACARRVLGKNVLIHDGVLCSLRNNVPIPLKSAKVKRMVLPKWKK